MSAPRGLVAALLALLALSAAAPARAALEQPALVADAVEAYRQGDYAAALEGFAALAAGETDPARRAVLHANAGTAAAHADDLGVAVWHLRAALADAPRDAVARRNLALVRARIADGAAQPSEDALSATLRRLPLWLTTGEVATLCGLAGLLALLLVAAWRAGFAPRGVAWTGVGVGVAALLFLWASSSVRAEEARRAVALQPLVIRGEPEADGRVVLQLAAGHLVRVDDDRGEWTLIETAGGGRGWVRSEAVLLP